MRVKETLKILEQIPVRELSFQNEDKLRARFLECARTLTRLNSQVVVSRGGSSRGGHSETRVYLEWRGNESKDQRHSSCHVIDCWSAVTKRSGFYRPVSMRAVLECCDWLEASVAELKGKKNPIRRSERG